MKAWSGNINKSIETHLTKPYEKFKSYERFKFVGSIIGKKLKNGAEFLDIGCGKGEFIYFLKDSFPDVRFTGIELSRELVVLAKGEPKLSDVTFIRADAQDFNLKKQFDYVLMSGVLSIFDDFRRLLARMAKHLKPGGYGYIFGCFNFNDIDVLVRYRRNYAGCRKWESGFNMFSLKTIEKALGSFSDEVNCYKFSLPIGLPKHPDSISSYTLDTKESGRIITNATNIITDFYLVEFKKRSRT
jgi:ubiquinone/menaquinone biosynthesis C-methylase UbiE